jgi:hypothetical protein
MSVATEMRRRASLLTLPMWVIYDHPSDYPEGFLARLWETLPGPTPTTCVATSAEAEALRVELQAAGFVKCERSADDEPQIMEIWL